MAAKQTADLRNVALVGHGDSGKTTLIEHLLHRTGAVSRLGKVADGTSVCDFDPEEKESKHTIDSALVHVTHKGKYLNWIDTPGYPDFVRDAIGAMRAVETAIVAVNAAAGVAVNTRKTFALAAREGVARAIVVTKMDAENAKVEELLASIQQQFGSACLPINVPVGVGATFAGVVDVLNPPASPPAGTSDVLSGARDRVLEAAVEVDDALLERYLNGETLSAAEVESVISRAIVAGKLVPILFTSSEKNLGLDELLNAVVTYFPSPKTGLRRVPKAAAADKDVPLEPDPAAHFSAQVFKTMTDPFVGKLSFFRIFSGTLKTDTNFYNPRTQKTEKLGHLQSVQGKEQKPIEEGVAGDICAISKVESLVISDTLCTEKDAVVYPPIKYPRSLVSLAVEPKNRNDEGKISTALHKLSDEDPTFLSRRDPQTKELVISGNSSLHLTVVLSRLKRRFGVEVVTHPPRIPYMETLTGKAEANYTHKKQSGGSGQYAKVFLRVEPLERGKGFEFEDATFGGSIPQQYIPSCEKGVKSVMEKGAIAGYPMVDIKASVFDGKDHPVDSKDIAFQVAARNAFKEACRNARPVLLEPIMSVEISIPTRCMGDITSDLNGRRGRVVGMDTVDDTQVIKATVPLAELTTYSTELRSITAGEGSFSMEFSHHDVVPAKIQADIVAKAKVHEESDEE